MDISEWTRYLFLLGVGAFVFSFVMFATWMKTGERMGIAIRKAYLEAILRQEVEWFDKEKANELSQRIGSETFAVQGAIGEKVPSIVVTISMTVFGFALAFATGWELALVTCATIPPLTLSTTLLISAIRRQMQATSTAYGEAGGIAEEVLLCF